MKAAPKPDLVARKIAKLIDAANPPPRVTVGDAFQSIVAPFILKISGDETAEKNRTLRRIDLWFIAYGKLETIEV